MASSIKIQQFRVSFIWFETQLSLLGLALPDASTTPFSFLGRNNSYEKIFNQIKQSPKGILALPLEGREQIGLTLPWKTSSTTPHYFWRYYLGQDKENVSARLAWEKFIPLRRKLLFAINADWLVPPSEWIELEAFYYPHGIALVTTIHCSLPDTDDLNDAVEKAFLVRKTGLFDVTYPEELKGPYQLDSLARKTMDFLHGQTWGSDSYSGLLSLYIGYPFSIFTVIQGEGVAENEPVSTNDEICRTLFEVTEWNKVYPDDELPAFDKAHVPIGKYAHSKQSDVLYGTNGRAVWFPEKFQKNGKDSMPGKLAAYHRNLVLTSLQVASLCGLVYESAKLLKSGNTFTPFHSDCLRRAADCLEGLYIGAEDSYRSYSARKQLEKNHEVLDALNIVREYWNMAPLPILNSISGDNFQQHAHQPIS